MDFHAEISYPDATADQAYALVVDRAFRAAVCEATHALHHDVKIDIDGERAVVTLHRTMPADVPDFVKKLVGKTVDVVQVERWGAPDPRGHRTAELTVEIKGQPAKLTGTITLSADGAGVRERVKGDLKVSIPLVGRKIEPEIAKGIHAAVEREQETGRAWLARP